ncbi:MAG: DUF1189 family protein [Legionellaceae bacterium]|nr:DUF1189 family protein [Legionellaceae bacterium]
MSTKIRTLDQPHYRYWEALYLCIWKPALYVDVFRRWKGFAWWYMVLVLLIVLLPLSVRVASNFNNFYENRLLFPLTHLPTVSVEHGQLTSSEKMPYLIRNEQQEVLGIVDTTGQYGKASFRKYPELTLLITKSKVYYRNPPFSFFLETDDRFSLPPEDIQEKSINTNVDGQLNGNLFLSMQGFHTLRVIVDIMLYPLLVGVMIGAYSTLFMVFSTMGQIIARYVLHYPLTYKQSCRLLVVASTPHLFVLGAFLFLRVHYWFSGFVLMGLMTGYFSYAVICCKYAVKDVVLRNPGK